MTKDDAIEIARRQAVAAYGSGAAKWGSFRLYISRNPLTGFWIGVALGASPVGALLLFFI